MVAYQKRQIWGMACDLYYKSLTRAEINWSSKSLFWMMLPCKCFSHNKRKHKTNLSIHFHWSCVLSDFAPGNCFIRPAYKIEFIRWISFVLLLKEISTIEIWKILTWPQNLTRQTRWRCWQRGWSPLRSSSGWRCRCGAWSDPRPGWSCLHKTQYHVSCGLPPL